MTTMICAVFALVVFMAMAVGWSVLCIGSRCSREEEKYGTNGFGNRYVGPVAVRKASDAGEAQSKDK